MEIPLSFKVLKGYIIWFFERQPFQYVDVLNSLMDTLSYSVNKTTGKYSINLSYDGSYDDTLFLSDMCGREIGFAR